MGSFQLLLKRAFKLKDFVFFIKILCSELLNKLFGIRAETTCIKEQVIMINNFQAEI